MKFGIVFSEPARLLFHFNGVSLIILERLENNGHAEEWFWEIPTHKIPIHLRTLGSKFRVIDRVVVPEEDDTPEVIRKTIDELLKIEEIAPDSES